jgi:hypothetical protein
MPTAFVIVMKPKHPVDREKISLIKMAMGNVTTADPQENATDQVVVRDRNRDAVKDKEKATAAELARVRVMAVVKAINTRVVVKRSAMQSPLNQQNK